MRPTADGSPHPRFFPGANRRTASLTDPRRAPMENAMRHALLACFLCIAPLTAQVLIGDLNLTGPRVGSNPANFGDAGEITLFSADDGVIGRELWRSRGTAATTGLLLDLFPGAN